MPDLLQTFADKTALHLKDLTEAVQTGIQGLKEPRESQLLKVGVLTCWFLNREFSRIVDTCVDWRDYSESRLREGINGNDLQDLVSGGGVVVGNLLWVAEVLAQLWDHLERTGAAAEEVARAHESLAATRGRLLNVKPWFDRLEKLLARTPPDIDPALIEKGAEEIRQGRFKTPAQIRQSLRDSAT